MLSKNSWSNGILARPITTCLNLSAKPIIPVWAREYWSCRYYRQMAKGVRQKVQCIFLLLLVLLFALCPPIATADQTENDYRQARLDFEKLLKDPQKQNLRHHWIACIKEFRSVYTAQPNGPRADDALLMTAGLYGRLYELSWILQDRLQALDYYTRLLKRFPASPFRSEAKKAIAELSTNSGKEIDQQKLAAGQAPVYKVASKPKAPLEIKKSCVQKKNSGLQAESLAEVKDIRFWSSPTYTRVVIDVESEVRYTHHMLKRDPSIAKPTRLYVDLNHARVGPGLKPVVPIIDDLLSGARAAQYSADTVRLVLDIKSIDDFKIFSLRNPFRIVIDIRGVPMKPTSKTVLKPTSKIVSKPTSRTVSKPTLKTTSKRQFRHKPEKPSGKVPKGALAKQLALGVKRIVIDPGHGGKDPGAIGYLKGVQEKNVTLEISRRLARKIRQRLGCEAILTRNSDTFLSLEERTAIANTKSADLFISLHTNATKTRASCGVETYFLNLATDKDAILVAARENATSAKNISDLEAILSDLMKNAKIDESSRLAGHVQEAMLRKLNPRYGSINDKGVKQAPFYVLLGAEMPCILIEVAFITNPRECRRLNTASYQEDIADAITTGIQRYIEEIHPAGLTEAAK
jgi:N-acetylmuramoyl-L-alanine amidase